VPPGNGRLVDLPARADGVIIPGTEVEKPAVNGGTLKLTIDSDLQWFMQQLIAEETARYQADWGGIIVMEAKTGKIRALAETKTVDPNDPAPPTPTIAVRACFASRTSRDRRSSP
jgi:cell division protein FtsI (penicillin-binding protein 3)